MIHIFFNLFYNNFAAPPHDIHYHIGKLTSPTEFSVNKLSRDIAVRIICKSNRTCFLLET
jgi:hypothetical protein